MATTPRVIDLGERRARGDFPAFAAIHCPPGSNPWVMSPNVMRWSDRILLVNLADCRTFWLEQKKKLRCKLIELFDPLLNHYYGDAYTAVFGRHPWQSLLLLHYLKDHARSGCYFLDGRLPRNIYRKLDWNGWFAPQGRLARHLDSINASGFRHQTFRARQAQMRRFIDRIEVDKPSGMQTAESNAIARRFGHWLGLIWRWTHTRQSGLQGFPWIRLQTRENPVVRRDLEYPVNDWACIEGLLREDFNRLCRLFPQNDCEHVSRMQWRITLFNDQKLTVELSFRHPYSLHREQPGFGTALYQASYVYQQAMRELEAREHDLDLPECMPFLSWEIEISERILLSPMLWDLFPAETGEIDYRQIMALQNKLPLAIESFQAEASFIPEQSFRAVAIGNPANDDPDHRPWSCGGINKPLFFYPEARPIELPADSTREFLERNAGEWWRGRDGLHSTRDYFRLRDSDGRSSWIYRDASGAWYRQGEFV